MVSHMSFLFSTQIESILKPMFCYPRPFPVPDGEWHDRWKTLNHKQMSGQIYALFWESAISTLHHRAFDNITTPKQPEIKFSS